MTEIDLSQLRKLIGIQVQMAGSIWEVIEVIERGPELVLESLSSNANKAIQTNQYGEAHRKVPHTISIPVIDPTTGDYHTLFLDTGLHDQIRNHDNH